MKKKLVLVPHYTGSLKYLLKLVPHLEGSYEVRFLFLPKIRPNFLEEMRSLAAEAGVSVDEIPRSSATGMHSFLTEVKRKKEYQRAIQQYLNEQKPEKFVLVSDADFYHAYLVDQAHKRGAETYLLQWGVALPREVRESMTRELAKKSVNSSGTVAKKVQADSPLRNVAEKFFGIQYGFRRSFATGESGHVGVANKYSQDCLIKDGVDEKKVTPVGTLEFDDAANFYKKLEGDTKLKKDTQEKLGLDSKKKHITIFASTPFYTKDMTVMSPEEQVDYYRNIVLIVREQFPEDEAEISYKIHPAEDVSLYDPLKEYGVKVFGKDTANEELIALADLYIDHHTTTNYMAMIMSKPCIFLNFVKLEFIDLFCEIMSIKQFVRDEDTFERLLKDFADGSLEQQYTLDSVFGDGKSVERILSWLG